MYMPMNSCIAHVATHLLILSATSSTPDVEFENAFPSMHIYSKLKRGDIDCFRRLPRVTKKGGGTGFTKLCGLSPELQKFLGASELPRTEVVKQLWVYIRENNLQDPNNRRNINCDKKLRTLFDVDSINMFQMNKVLSTHIHSLGTNNVGPDKSAQKEKPRKQERRGPDESIPKKKRPKGESSGTTAFLAPLPLSDALVKFIGTGESKLPRSEVVKRMWNYIKENKLQDPADKRRIICDEKLKELFEVDSFVGFTAPKLLVPHLNPKKINRE